MSESRNIRWDIAALVLAAFSFFVWMSLLSYDAADPLTPAPALAQVIYRPYLANQIAFPVNTSVTNRCGYFGAFVAQAMFHAFGAGAFIVGLLLILAVVVTIRQKPLASPLGRSIGWTLVLVALLSLMEITKMRMQMALPLGPGGAIGVMGAMWLASHFAFFGSVIICLCCLVIGMMLSTEYAVFRGLSFVTIGMIVVGKRLGLPVAHVVKKGAEIGSRKLATARASASVTVKSDSSKKELDEVVEEREPYHGEPNGPMIRIGGKGKGPNAEPAGKAAEKAGDKAAEKPVIKAEEESKEPAEPKKQNPLRTRSITTSAVSKIAGKLGAIAGLKDSREEEDEVHESNEGEYEDEGEEENFVDLNVDGEDITARIDNVHDGAEPKIKNRKSRNEKPPASFLDTLDDTRLPDGAEEYVLPGLDLLIPSEDFSYEEQMVEIRRKAKILEQTFADFGFNIRVVEIETGPVIAQYEIELEAGLRLSKITSLADDLAIALRVPSVRIVAPIPGKNTVGIEVPNEKRQIVRMREVIEEAGDLSKMKIPLFLGKDVSGKALSVDLASMPHLLIAGRTGTGKSVCLNTIIASMLMTRRPDEVRMLMIDPKMVELSGYARLPHLMHPVVTDMQKAEAILAWAVDKMEERYALLAKAGVRHLVGYNQLDRAELLERIKPESPEEEAAIPEHIPFIVIVADEIADMMMTAGKEVEQHIIRLAQKSRAVGIHLILATQKPTVDVITGLIKSNLPARISFQVASRTDSRVVLDEMGADKLLGNGDMLFLWPGTSTLLRGQGTYMGDDEINRVVNHCSQGEQKFVHELMNISVEKEEDGSGKEAAAPGSFRKRDDLYEAAVDVVVREGRGSCSLLQRALGIGYGRAARLVDFMAEDGIVGQYNGSQARDVIISIAQWEAMRGGGTAAASAAPEPVRKNKIQRADGWGDESSREAVLASDQDADESEDWDD